MIAVLLIITFLIIGEALKQNENEDNNLSKIKKKYDEVQRYTNF